MTKIGKKTKLFNQIFIIAILRTQSASRVWICYLDQLFIDFNHQTLLLFTNHWSNYSACRLSHTLCCGVFQTWTDQHKPPPSVSTLYQKRRTFFYWTILQVSKSINQSINHLVTIQSSAIAFLSAFQLWTCDQEECPIRIIHFIFILVNILLKFYLFFSVK